MTVLVKKYPVFEDNQVLTSSQLNNLVEYLDQQNRLTRVALIGVGIACGLKISCKTTADGDRLIISGGVGVTSEGYLVNICSDCTINRVRTYEKPDIVSYPPFEDEETGEQDVKLFELLTEAAETDPQDDVVPFDKAEFDDMAVLLYIECFDKDLKSCLGKSCDELGIDRFLNVRKLLISRDDLTKVLDRTEGGYQDVEFPERFNLPHIVMPRVFFPPNSPQSDHYALYSANYVMAVGKIYNNLIDALKKSFDTYQPLLEPVYGENPFESAAFLAIQDEWIKYATGADGSALPFLGIQYFYDFFKDLILAYTEFRDEACSMLSLCCPDTDRFPKHLILGFLDQSAAGGTTDEARHGFTQPPLYGNQKGLLEHVIRLHKKIVLLIEGFNLDTIRTDPVEGKQELKITPSCEKKSFLSDRSIPYYYEISQASSFGFPGNLEETWRGTNKPRLGRAVLSYARNKTGVPGDDITAPLDYDLDAYNFLRIEGHLGMNVKSAIKGLQEFKHNKNLEFEIRPVYLGDEGLELGYPQCLCADIQPDYSIWRNKTLYFLKTLLALTTRLASLYSKRSSIKSAFVKSFDGQDDTAATTTTETTESDITGATGFTTKASFSRNTRPISINQAKLTNLSDIKLDVGRNNWEFAGHQLITAFDNVATAEKNPNDNTTIGSAGLGDSPTFADYLNFYNDCLGKLVDSMKVDLKDFDFQAWKKHYTCTLQVHIEIMKRIASLARNPKITAQVFVILFIYCIFYKMITFLCIYPYIAIGVIADTLKFRKEKFQEALKFSNFLKKHPGADHKAGVHPGGTFLLLYLSQSERGDKVRELIEKFFNREDSDNEGLKVFEDLPGNVDGLDDILNELEGTVVGDFSLNGSCCDDCGDMPNAALTLDPLGVPVCGVVRPVLRQEESRDDPFFSNYRDLKMRMISHVYERETYRTNVPGINDLQFGTLKFDMVDSTFEFHFKEGEKIKAKKVEEMTYSVSPEAIADFHKNNPDAGMAIEEFDYEIIDKTRNDEVVCKNKVTIFIPVIPSNFDQEPQVATVTGIVRETNANGPAIFEANVAIASDGGSSTLTNDNGQFILTDVPEGDNQELVVSKAGYFPNRFQINVNAPTTNVGTVILVRRPIVDVNDFGFGGTFELLRIQPGSTEALRVFRNFRNNLDRNKKEISSVAELHRGDAKVVLENTSATIEEFADSKDLKVVRLNNEYAKRRDEIIEVMNTLPRTQRSDLNKALQLLTTTYLERLAVLQPAEFTGTTIENLAKSAELFNANPELKLNTAVTRWVKNSRGNVSPEFEKNLKTNFKLER